MAKQLDCMIWSEGGTWLQTTDKLGAVRWSYCGQLSYDEAREFCFEAGLPFFEHKSPIVKKRQSVRYSHA